MKKILLMLVPLIIIVLALRPLASHTLKGTISDDTGNPVGGVSIRVKGTSVGTSSASNVTYSLTMADKKSTIVITSVGYISREVKVKGRSVINLKMSSGKAEIEEVVITGTERKMNIS